MFSLLLLVDELSQRDEPATRGRMRIFLTGVVVIMPLFPSSHVFYLMNLVGRTVNEPNAKNEKA